jgi:hypothetical protein
MWLYDMAAPAPASASPPREQNLKGTANMSRLISLVVALSLFVLAGAAIAAAPAVQDVQGLYEGTRTDSAGAHKFEARVVALGKGEYKVFIREASAAVVGGVVKVELDGKTEGEAVTFTGKVGPMGLTGDSGICDWAASYAGGTIKGTCGKDGKVEMKRVDRVSPTMGVKPPLKGPQGPAGAVVLIDGKNFSEVVAKPGKDGKVPEWKVADDGGVLVVKGGITSKRSFDGSFKLHVEFKSPLVPDGRGQGRGNSGCFMPNGDEVQVLDSFGMTTYTGGGCGGIYKYKDPDAFDAFSLASAPPGQWQTYDIEYTVESADGKPAGKPVITVLHNGIKIHDKFRLQRDAKAGTFQFQDHGNPVQYRNIWVLPIK